MKILLLGYGKMGHKIEELAQQNGQEIVGRIGTEETYAPTWPIADVAINFSAAEIVGGHLHRISSLGIPMVIGTTGWNEREEEFRAIAKKAGIGIVASGNFSIGVNVF